MDRVSFAMNDLSVLSHATNTHVGLSILAVHSGGPSELQSNERTGEVTRKHCPPDGSEEASGVQHVDDRLVDAVDGRGQLRRQLLLRALGICQHSGEDATRCVGKAYSRITIMPLHLLPADIRESPFINERIVLRTRDSMLLDNAVRQQYIWSRAFDSKREGFPDLCTGKDDSPASVAEAVADSVGRLLLATRNKTRTRRHAVPNQMVSLSCLDPWSGLRRRALPTELN